MEETERPESEIETPVNNRPDLTDYGIEEFDRGICADTYENRTILRKNKFKWKPIYDREGVPTQHIEVLSQQMSAVGALATLEDRKIILEDPRDKNSDYLTGLDLLYESEADALVAPWVLNATRSYYNLLEQRKSTGKNSRPNLIGYPARCAFIKADGVRCMLWTAGRETDAGFCRIHLTAVNNHAHTGALEKARNRITQAAPSAVDTLEELMESAVSEPVRLGAAKEILDRAGIRGGVEIDVKGTLEVKPAAEVLRDRMLELKEAKDKKREIEAAALEAAAAEEANTVDAEIVEDDE